MEFLEIMGNPGVSSYSQGENIRRNITKATRKSKEIHLAEIDKICRNLGADFRRGRTQKMSFCRIEKIARPKSPVCGGSNPTEILF